MMAAKKWKPQLASPLTPEPGRLNAYVTRTGQRCVATCPDYPEAVGESDSSYEALERLERAIKLAMIGGVRPRNRRTAPKPDPIQLITETDRIQPGVYAAFASVTRDGSVSWSEAEVYDLYGSESEFRKARKRDKDARWIDLIDDPDWQSAPGVGGFSFVDPISFRYYLPAAMIRSLRSRTDEGIQFHLTLPDEGSALRDFSLQQWSQLSQPQCVCIARFIECMVLVTDWDRERENWEQALQRYWMQFLKQTASQETLGG